MKKRKLLEQAINNPKGVRFNDLVTLVLAFGFTFERQSGSHQIFRHPQKRIQLNLQSEKGMAKPYQVRQFIQAVELHALTLDDSSRHD